VAAPRIYSDQQRASMFRLFEAGKTPAEIARLCEEGTAGVSPFTIPRRTCHDIVTRMAEEAERKLPTSVAEAESAEAVERFPMRIARLVDAEITRLTTTQEKSGLSLGDYDKLERAAKLSCDLEKRLRQRKPAGKRGGRGSREGAGSPPAEESVLARLAREQGERDGREVHLSPAHSRPDAFDPAPEDAAIATGEQPDCNPSADEQAASTAPLPTGEEQREEAARKSRAALTGAR